MRRYSFLQITLAGVVVFTLIMWVGTPRGGDYSAADMLLTEDGPMGRSLGRKTGSGASPRAQGDLQPAEWNDVQDKLSSMERRLEAEHEEMDVLRKAMRRLVEAGAEGEIMGGKAKALLKEVEDELDKQETGRLTERRGSAMSSRGSRGNHIAGGAEERLSTQDKALWAERAEEVRGAMRHAWDGYRKYAWGMDEIMPKSKRGKDSFGSLGATIVDSLDTLWLMGLDDRFKDARGWVEEQMRFDRNQGYSVFETNIRCLGGLLASYDLSGDPMFLRKAEELAEALLPAFDTPTGIPVTNINFHTGKGTNPSWSGGHSNLAEFGTLQLEWLTLAARTGKQLYSDKVDRIFDVIQEHPSPDGLYDTYMDQTTGLWRGGGIRFGALGDSFYEYLIKTWVWGGKTRTVERYKDMFITAMTGMHNDLVRKSGDLTVIGNRHGGPGSEPELRMDHLACFVPGMLLLGRMNGAEAANFDSLQVAEELTETCHQFYARSPSGLSGESATFKNGEIHMSPAYNILRPETIESYFYMYRYTKDIKYREWGWEAFQAFQRHCKTDAAYAGLNNAWVSNPSQDDTMQSFFLAETLKYFFLLFSPDDVLSLDEFVLNTEAHPLRVTSWNRR